MKNDILRNKVLSKQVREDEKYTGADTSRFPTARGLELSGESSIVENTKWMISIDSQLII